MKKLLTLIDADPGYTPVSSEEQKMLSMAINIGYVRGTGCETSNEYIALFLTKEGKAYIQKNSK